MARIKPRGPRRTGASWLRFVFVWPLEDDFGHELDVASFAGADGGGAVEVTDGVGDLTEATGGRADSSSGGRCANATNRAYSRRHVDAVEKVKEVRAKLDFDPLGDWDVLNKRQVHIPKTRPGKFVSREVCRAWAGRPARRAERSRVPPLLAKARIKLMADTLVRIAD